MENQPIRSHDEQNMSLKELILSHRADNREMMLRLESTVNDRLSALRTEVSQAQSTSVSKAEFHSAIETLHREVSRIESQYRDQMREIKADYRDQIRTIEADIKASTQRLIGGAAVLLAVIQFFVTNIK